MTVLVTLLAGVVSTIPVVVSTWPTVLTTPSSKEGVLVVPRVGIVAAPTQRLSYALGDPAAPSRHMPAVSAVPGPLPLPCGQGLSGTSTLSIQGDTSKNFMEINEEPIENLTDCLIDNELLEDFSSNRDDRLMEIDNTCLGQLIDIVHLDASEHKVGKLKRKQLRKKKSPGKQKGGKGGQEGANGNDETNLKTLVLTIDAPEASP